MTTDFERGALAKQALVDIECAIGGSYELSDGRKFWLDAVTVREIMKRAVPFISAECERHRHHGERHPPASSGAVGESWIAQPDAQGYVRGLQHGREMEREDARRLAEMGAKPSPTTAEPRGCPTVGACSTHPMDPAREAACREPYHWDDGVPYCDKCGLFRNSVTRALAADAQQDPPAPADHTSETA